ncbi:MAG TPA: hypothetical protein VJ785_07250 [Anaerolineales bacterium]|nr:hypothetical protein [Anaerolineales bacterium]
MKIPTLERELPGEKAENFHQYAREEALKAWELHPAGFIRELYFRADQNEAVLILESPNIAEAEQTLAELPLVREGLIPFEIISLKAYPGFERLFTKD